MFRAKTKDGQWVYKTILNSKWHGDNGYYCESKNILPETISQDTGQTDNTKWEDLTPIERDEWLKDADGMPRELIVKHILEWKGRKIFGSFKLDGVMTKGGDVVEVFGCRVNSYNQVASKHDGDYKLKAQVIFKNGSWKLDYDNDHNNQILTKKGKEKEERHFDWNYKELYQYWSDDKMDWHYGNCKIIGKQYEVEG